MEIAEGDRCRAQKSKCFRDVREILCRLRLRAAEYTQRKCSPDSSGSKVEARLKFFVGLDDNRHNLIIHFLPGTGQIRQAGIENEIVSLAAR